MIDEIDPPSGPRLLHFGGLAESARLGGMASIVMQTNTPPATFILHPPTVSSWCGAHSGEMFFIDPTKPPKIHCAGVEALTEQK
jgi:hypothetical protein